jgi:hypothetical protein
MQAVITKGTLQAAKVRAERGATRIGDADGIGEHDGEHDGHGGVTDEMEELLLAGDKNPFDTPALIVHKSLGGTGDEPYVQPVSMYPSVSAYARPCLSWWS